MTLKTTDQIKNNTGLQKKCYNEMKPSRVHVFCHVKHKFRAQIMDSHLIYG